VDVQIRMLVEEGDIGFLIQFGLTETQAKLYLALHKMGKANVRTLQKTTKIPRQAIYRAIDELQEKGFVDKEIALPNYFKATPIQLALHFLVKQKMEECSEIVEKAKVFMKRFQPFEEETVQEQDYKIIIMNGKERIIHKMKKQHDDALTTIDILSTLPRWLQIMQECRENYARALKRGVKYRLIIETSTSEVVWPKNILALLEEGRLKLKISTNFSNTNSAVFDGKEATFNFYPSRILAESPIIWTNHPTFLSMAQEHFEKHWKSATSYNLNR
jgi:sugar-specific transcriptional regulator TrmB